MALAFLAGLALTGCAQSPQALANQVPTTPGVGAMTSSPRAGGAGGILEVLIQLLQRLFQSGGNLAQAGTAPTMVPTTSTSSFPGTSNPTGTIGQPATSAPGGLQAGDSGTLFGGGAGAGRTFNVICTSFGPQKLAGKTVEDGNMYLSAHERGAALPSRKGLGKWMAVSWKGREVIVPVIDVGPWNIKDDYWNKSGQPLAEREVGQTTRGTLEHGQTATLQVNGAGLDLTWQTWKDLGSPTKHVLERVTWRFVDEATGVAWFQSRGIRVVRTS